jgi:hypothetical protein
MLRFGVTAKDSVSFARPHLGVAERGVDREVHGVVADRSGRLGQQAGAREDGAPTNHGNSEDVHT